MFAAIGKQDAQNFAALHRLVRWRVVATATDHDGAILLTHL
jgi:hypothetical protein